MQALALCTGEAFVRPTRPVHNPQASTSPRCAFLATITSLRRRGGDDVRSSTTCSWRFPKHLYGCSGFLRTIPSSMATASSSMTATEEQLQDDSNAEPTDTAEQGGRDYLQLAAQSDASLQVRLVQWYPGHIARAERQLKAQLAMVDVVLEVRDARILVSTHHPHLDSWLGTKPRLLLINRADEVTPADLTAWRQHFAATGQRVFWTNGRNGDGVKTVRRELLKVAAELNAKRARRGLQPRPVRACVIGFPNIGKSALINRLVGRRAVASAPKPGITRVLRWVRVDPQLDLLDAPGVIPASFRDQLAAQRLAICNDIGEAAYLCSAVGAAMVLRVKQLAAADGVGEGVMVGAAGVEGEGHGEEGGGQRREEGQGDKKVRTAHLGKGVKRVEGGVAARDGPGGAMAGVLAAMRRRYGLDPLTVGSAEDFIVALADRLFGGDVERAGGRLLSDYRSGALGCFALERPGDLAGRARREAGLKAAEARRERQEAADTGGEENGDGGASVAGWEDGGLQEGAVGLLAEGPVEGWGSGGGGGVSDGGWEVGRAGEENSAWVRQAEAWAQAQGAGMSAEDQRPAGSR